jgi:hypothetical protein
MGQSRELFLILSVYIQCDICPGRIDRDLVRSRDWALPFNLRRRRTNWPRALAHVH